MDIKALHEKFKDEDSPSVQGQIRWLQKQGFMEHQINNAMLSVYSDIEAGKIPVVYTREEVHPDGKTHILKKYQLKDQPHPGEGWSIREIRTGWDLDQVILEEAKRFRTQDLTAIVRNIEQFESDLRAKWEAEQKAKQKPGFFKRLFGSSNQ